MTGESLFNDGVGVALFAVLVAIAAGIEGGAIDLVHIGELFFVEALGGAALGLVSGYIAYRAMRAIADFVIEVLISLALWQARLYTRRATASKRPHRRCRGRSLDRQSRAARFAKRGNPAIPL